MRKHLLSVDTKEVILSYVASNLKSFTFYRILLVECDKSQPLHLYKKKNLAQDKLGVSWHRQTNTEASFTAEPSSGNSHPHLLNSTALLYLSALLQ